MSTFQGLSQRAEFKATPLLPIQLADLGNSPNPKVRDDAKCQEHQKFAPTRLPQNYSHRSINHIPPPSAPLLSRTNEPANPPIPSQSPHAHSSWFVPQHTSAPPPTLLTPRKQNALFNSALRQSTSLRKDLDHFADTASPSPALQGQISASLTSLSRTIDDYAKLAKQEPVQTKQEKAFERVKSFRAELEEYRESFRRVKSANEDMVRFAFAFEGRNRGLIIPRVANKHRARRTARPPSPQRRHAREPLREHIRRRRTTFPLRTLTALQSKRSLPTKPLLRRRSPALL